MKRRELIAGGISLAPLLLLSGCKPELVRCRAAPLSPTAGIVDAHCHIFNGRDLPTVRFIEIVILKAYPKEAVAVLDIEDPDALTGLIALFSWIVGATRAPSAGDEVKVLDKQTEAQRANVESAANDEAVIDALAEVMADGSIAVSDDVSPSSIRKIRRAIFEAAGEGPIAVDDGELERAEARAIAKNAYESKFDLGVMLRWFALFTRYRYVLSEQLCDDYRRQAFQPLLLCPALIDYDYWLRENVDDSPIPDQVKVMGRLARRESGPTVHGYIGFDPLRQAAFDHGERRFFDPLATVLEAVRTEGFLGVKLYPPMGFRPIGNGAASGQTYPDYPIVQKLAATEGLFAVGRKLDDAMGRLFDLCVRESACVIAHAGNSNGANENYGLRADPAYWLDVFKRWPSLHVCLAHFGSFDTRSATAPVGADLPEASWEWTLGRYIKAHPGSPVFADISYLTEIGGQSPADLASYAGLIKRWLDEFDPSCEHLIYGSDWIMLGIDQGYENYVQRVHEFFLVDIGLDPPRMARLFSGNAARFLGLREGDAARARLLSFYDRHGLPHSRLPTFEAGQS